MLTQFAVICGQAALTLIFVLLVFGVPCNGPVGWLIGLTLMQGTAGMCYGKIKDFRFHQIYLNFITRSDNYS